MHGRPNVRPRRYIASAGLEGRLLCVYPQNKSKKSYLPFVVQRCAYRYLPTRRSPSPGTPLRASHCLAMSGDH